MMDAHGLDDRDYTAEALAEKLTDAGFNDEFALTWVRGYGKRVADKAWKEGYEAGYADRGTERYWTERYWEDKTDGHS
ncbi:hypothetical protein ACQCX2_07685 [Propionibacteriaceae bacterium Y1700]|uniref:hypothetical protein n=1 Tax=Microlunatus sp. Y1700 TaxID=3418487 RepID=UPI003DA70FAF